jgi:hypothetical protein
MSFADPQSITINSIANSLPRIASGVNSGVFQKDDGNVRLSVSHSYGNRTRRTMRVDHRKIAADPLISAQNIQYSMSVYVVTDLPVTGYTVSEAQEVIDGFTAYLTASSGAKVTQWLGGEN